MYKKITVALFIMFWTVVMVSGCSIMKPPFDDGPVKDNITGALSGFETAVESYDVTGMLANFENSDTFKLTISEGDWSYDKDYITLEQELDDDAPAQLAWRQTVADGGHDYALDLVLGTYVFSNLSATGGIATQTFQVWESADGIPQMKTDNGTITWHMALMANEWKVVAMTIRFQALNTSNILSSKNTIRTGNGFGFTTIAW